MVSHQFDADPTKQVNKATCPRQDATNQSNDINLKWKLVYNTNQVLILTDTKIDSGRQDDSNETVRIKSWQLMRPCAHKKQVLDRKPHYAGESHSLLLAAGLPAKVTPWRRTSLAGWLPLVVLKI